MLFDDEDLRTKRTVALLGATLAANLFPETDGVGTAIRLGKTPFTVIGVLARKGQTATGADQDDIVLMPLHHRAEPAQRPEFPGPDRGQYGERRGARPCAGRDPRDHAGIA